jgi:hypothetical protein
MKMIPHSHAYGCTALVEIFRRRWGELEDEDIALFTIAAAAAAAAAAATINLSMTGRQGTP